MLEYVIFKATREKTPNICDRSPHSCTDAMVCLLLKMNKVYIFTITLEWLDLAPKRQIFFRQNNGIFTIWCRKYTQIWPFLTRIAPKIVKKMCQELDSLGLFLQIMKPISSWKLAALEINKMILFPQ